VSYRAYALEYVENALDASLSHVPLNCDKCRVAYKSYTTASWICLQKYTTLSVLGRKGEICHIAWAIAIITEIENLYHGHGIVEVCETALEGRNGAN
jgi:hypothetical protein